jgi:putative flippase GtrA
MKVLAKFFTVGAVNTIIGMTCIYAAMGLFGLGMVASNAIGYGVGLVVAFILNRTWTFADTNSWHTSFLRWLLVVAVGYLANLAGILIAHGYLAIDPYIAQLAGLGAYTATTFLGARYFAFSSHAPQARQP